MKNILSLYKKLFLNNLSSGEAAGNNAEKSEMSFQEAQNFVNRYKDFAEFYEKSDSAKSSVSNRLRYEEYQRALLVLNNQSSNASQDVIGEVEKIDAKEITSAIKYNLNLPEYIVYDVKYVLGLEKAAPVDEKFVYLVRNFQKLKGLEVDGKVGPNTFKEILSSARNVKSAESARRLSIESVKNSFEKSTREIVDKANLGKDLTLEEKNDLDKAISLAERQISEVIELSEDMDVNKRKIIGDFSNELNKLKELTAQEIGYETIVTKEEFSAGSSEFMGLFSRGNFDTREFLNSLPADSRVSLEKILSSSNLSEIYNNLLNVSPKNEKGNNYFLDYLIGENYSEFILEVKKLGYNPDGLFDDKEALMLLNIIGDYVKNQNNVSSLNDNQKIQLLLDFDKNGNLTVDKNFVVGELQSLNALKGLNSDGIDALMKNLGLGTIADFSNEMQSNLFTAREKFQRVLSTLVNSRVSIAELTQKNGVEKSFENMLDKQNEITKQIGEEIDNSQKLENKLSTLSEAQREELKKVLKLEAVAGVINGSKIGLGTSFDIKDYTAKIIDSVGFGIYDGKPGVAITKEVYSSDNFNVKASLVNIVIPVLSASYDFDVKNDHNGLFNKELDKSYSPTVYASISLKGGAAGIHFSKVDHSTKVGIDHMINETSKSLQLIKTDLLAGKNFQESQYFEKSQNKETDLIVYNELKAVCDKFAGTPDHKHVVEVILRGYKEFYENHLYQNAQGINFSGAGVGIALIKGYLPLPYLTISFDKLSINFKTINDRLDGQREVNSKLLDLSKVGLKYEELDGKNVYSIIDNGNIEFSSDTGSVEVLRKDGKIYFSGENIQSVKFEEYFGQESGKLVVIINGGKTSENGEYLKSTETNIVTSQKENIFTSMVLDSAKIRELNKETIENTLDIRNNLFNLISKDAIPSPNTPGMTKLQDMIYNMSTNSGVTLSEAWTQFERVINDPKFINYAKEKNGIDNLIELKIHLGKDLTNAEKLMILQSIPACLMKVESLKMTDGKVNVGKTIAAYDSRASYFDKIFTNEAGDILPEIQAARNDWFEANGNKSRYEFRQVGDGDIAFSGTRIKSGGKNVLMPYMGSFNVADAGKPEIEIVKKSKDLVDRLPNEYLDLIRDNLTSKGVNVYSNENLKDLLKGEEIGGIRLDYKQYFVKMGECLNDAIVLKDINVVGVSEISSTSSANLAQRQNVKLGLAVSGEMDKKEKSQEPGEPDTEPEIEETDGPDSEPEIEEVNGGDTGGITSSGEGDFN